MFCLICQRFAFSSCLSLRPSRAPDLYGQRQIRPNISFSSMFACSSKRPRHDRCRSKTPSMQCCLVPCSLTVSSYSTFPSHVSNPLAHPLAHPLPISLSSHIHQPFSSPTAHLTPHTILPSESARLLLYQKSLGKHFSFVHPACVFACASS